MNDAECEHDLIGLDMACIPAEHCLNAKNEKSAGMLCRLALSGALLVASVIARSPRFHAAGDLESNGADEDIGGRWHRPDSAGTEGWRYDVRFGAHRARGTFRNITS